MSRTTIWAILFSFLLLANQPESMYKANSNQSGATVGISGVGFVIASSEVKPEDLLKQEKFDSAYQVYKAKLDKDPENKKVLYFVGLTALKVAEQTLHSLKSNNSLKKEYVPDTLEDIKTANKILVLLAEASGRLSAVPPKFNKMDFPSAGELSDEITNKAIPETNAMLKQLQDHKQELQNKVTQLLAKEEELKVAGKLDDAKKIIAEAIEIEPGSAEASLQQTIVEYLLLSNRLLAQNKFEDSRNKALEAKNLDPNNAYIPQLIGKIDLAESDYLMPSGQKLLSNEQFGEAYPIIKKCSMLDPNNTQKAGCLKECRAKWVDALCLEAQPLIQQYRLREAESNYLKALEVFPQSEAAKTKYTAFQKVAGLYHAGCAASFAAAGLNGNALANFTEANHYDPASAPAGTVSLLKSNIKSQSKLNLAIMDFDDAYGQAGQLIRSGVMNNAMQWPVVQQRKLDVLPRNMIQQIFSGQQTSSGLMDQSAIMQAGKARGVSVFVFGKVTGWNSDTTVQLLRTEAKKYQSGSHMEQNPKYQECMTKAQLGNTALNLLSAAQGSSKTYDVSSACAGIPREVSVPDYTDCSYEVNSHTSFATVGVDIQIIDAETNEVIYSNSFSQEAKNSDEELKPYDMSCAGRAGIQPKTAHPRPVQTLQKEAVNAIINDISQNLLPILDPANIWTKKAEGLMNAGKYQDAIEVLAKLFVFYPDTDQSKNAESQLIKIYSQHPDSFIRQGVAFDFSQVIPQSEGAAPPGSRQGKRGGGKRRPR